MEEIPIKYYKGNAEQEFSIEDLKKEVAQYLQMDNLCFLIGAGCSSYIVDGKETGIPKMTNLYNRFLENTGDFRVANEPVEGLFDNNLEKLLELMESVDIVNQIVEIDNNIKTKKTEVCAFLREQIIEGLNCVEIQDIYKSFYIRITQRMRKNPINIFTTNYDLFNEIALDDLGFPYNNGFFGTYKRKFNPTSYNYTYVESMNLHHDVWEQVPSFFNLIKLHGSITWVRDMNNQMREVDYDKIKPDETVMIYPTPLKDRSTLMTPYSDLFRIMENKLLQKNSILIVLGYSFGDDHINRIILNGLAIPSFRLVIFGDGNNINQLIERNDSRITVINSEDKIHYFKNFVERVLPSVHPDVEEMLRFSTT